MSEPTTEAGRQFRDALRMLKYDGMVTASIELIEREAVAQERARLRAAVEGLPARGDMMALMVSRAAVLRVLDPEAEGGTE